MSSIEAREELETLPLRQYASGVLHCDFCRSYHALWPMLRVSRQVGGVEADEPMLGPLLAGLLGTSPKHVVLAGSADSGVLAMVHRAALAAGGARHRFTLVDRCATPFDACRFHADRNGIALATQLGDLRAMPALKADLIVGHSVMPFIPREDRHRALVALREALAPGGRIVLSARLSAPQPEREADQVDPARPRVLADRIAQGMQAAGVALPCSPVELDAMVQAWVAANSFHVAPYEEHGALRADLEAADFFVERVMPIGRGVDFLKDGTPRRGVKQGFVAVARAAS